MTKKMEEGRNLEEEESDPEKETTEKTEGERNPEKEEEETADKMDGGRDPEKKETTEKTEGERNPEKKEEITKKMEGESDTGKKMEEGRNPEKQMAEESEPEESFMRWWKMVTTGKMIAEEEVKAKKRPLRRGEVPGLGDEPGRLIRDPRIYYPRKFDRDRMEVGSSSGHPSQSGQAIGQQALLVVQERPQISRPPESLNNQSKVLEAEDVDWYSRLCSLAIPNKYKTFIKLACEEKLAVRAVDTLFIDSKCPCCGEDAQKVMHCLWECPHAMIVWSISSLSWRVVLLSPSTFRQLLRDVTMVLEEDYDLALFVLICWCLWEARSDHVLQSTELDEPDAIMKKALLLLKKTCRWHRFLTWGCRIS